MFKVRVFWPAILTLSSSQSATLSPLFIISVMDLLGVFIYFGFANAFLDDLLTQATG